MLWVSCRAAPVSSVNVIVNSIRLMESLALFDVAERSAIMNGFCEISERRIDLSAMMQRQDCRKGAAGS